MHRPTRGRVQPAPLTLVVALVLGAVAPQATFALGKCDARKKQCVSQRAAALLKCHRKAEEKGLPVDPSCVDHADDKFDGGDDPTKGCFERAEDKFPPSSPEACTTYDDTASIGADIETFVQNVLAALGNPAESACARKDTCAGTLVKNLLKCHSKADQRGVPVDTVCLDDAKGKYDGADEPCRGCVRRIEDAHPPATADACPTFGNTHVLSVLARRFVDCVVARLADPSGMPCSTTPPPCGLPACVTFAGQVPDCSYSPVISDPSYPICTGPKILVDTTHANFHQITPLSDDNPGRYWGFARLLHDAGYDVRDNDVPFSALLPGTDAKIIVIANARECFATDDAVPDDDVVRLLDWVRAGGSLLLVVDHPPYERVPGLLAALGLEHPPAAATVDPACSLACQHCPNRCQTFLRADGSLNGMSPLADGPSPPATAVDAVSTFAGTVFALSPTPPSDATYEPVLVFPAGSTARSAGSILDIGGMLQGVAIELGGGRVYVSGEAGGLTAQGTFGMQFTPENERFLLNVIAWLDD